MPRERQRRTLDTGPRLDINELIRAGLRSGTFKARMADRPAADRCSVTLTCAVGRTDAGFRDLAYLLNVKKADPPPPLSVALSLLPFTVTVIVPDTAYSAL